MKILQKYTKYVSASLVMLILLACLMLASVQIIRYYQNDQILPGQSSFFLVRLSEHFKDNLKPLFYDDLSYPGRVMSLQQGSSIILGAVSKIFNLESAESCIVIPPILGILSLIAFYFIVLKLVSNRKISQLSMLFLLLSPPFIYIFSTCNLRMFPITITLAAIAFLLHKKQFLAGLSFFIIPFFGTLDAVIATSLFLVSVIARKQNKKLFLLMVFLNLATISLLNLNTIRTYSIPEALDFKVSETGVNFTFQNFIAEFGGRFGLSLFSIMLAFSGLTSLWKKKYRYINVYLALLFFLSLSIYLIWPIVHLNFIVSMLAAIGLIYLQSIRWESKLIKNFTTSILLLGLVFTSIIHINRTASLLPNQDIIDSLQALNAESNPGDVILSHYTNGYWIETVASRPAFLDSSFVYSPDINSRYSDAEMIFRSRSIDEVSRLLEKNGIKYIWITKDMKSGLVWQDEEQGLLFLLHYNTKFKKLFSNSETELWWYKGD